MIEILLIVIALLLLVALVLLIVLVLRRATTDWSPLHARLDAVDKAQERSERAVKDEVARNRDEAAAESRGLREELGTVLKGFNDSLLKQMAEIAALQNKQIDAFAVQLAAGGKNNEQKLEALRFTLETQLKALIDDNARRLDHIRQDAGATAKLNRDESAAALKSFNDSLVRSVGEMASLQRGQLETLTAALAKLTETDAKKLDELKAAVETRLGQLQTDNAAKLEEMRRTVDEKLQGTLERRLGESFKLVSERLELVHRGLGEMQTLASGVGDLKKVLTNVKTRGTWGEIQLGNLLEQVLSPEQYAQNVITRVGSSERVEYAIKLPGRDDPAGQVVWLPIDAKFPREDFERLVECSERADAAGVEEAARQLEARVKSCARDIRDKYLDPPHTTDFGLLFLPAEGLYAEVLRRPGLVEQLQREFRVNLTGPTTLAAFLNSLQMGFRTLAIQQRSSEVWEVLGAVKTEFGKFGDVLDKVQKKLHEASHVIDTAATRSRVIERRLRSVQELPVHDAAQLLDDGESPAHERETEAGTGELPMQP